MFQRIGIIGAGRVGRALAVALAERSDAPVVQWARRAGAGTTDRLGDLAGCDLWLIAVADDALGEVVAALAQVPATHRPFVAHVSGRSGVAPLAPLAGLAGGLAAIHPAMTFTGDPVAEVARMAGARFAITGADGAAQAMAERIVAALGGVPVAIAEAQRALYHAALCHGANHLVTLVADACAVLRAAGVADGAGVLGPLVRAALDNALAGGMAALSGPVLRGDAQTIAGHAAALRADCPQVWPAYQAMAGATVRALEQAGSPDSRDAILRAIAD
ncbi:DUF2520 domain-containing protein [Novosphingobium sp. FSY-8]|uniref:DUF2520 domain-containing protein n=1 Tax=Novosphingobium ovatum TaxID=1908523 RepID=A0ABW9X951_9SPHN|nr:DUF2520 domain-containing protein [Novosphingobium ovatum]NBC35061.1 DUF2520 domain-containing protein [Novosphingobium ovatum]